MTFLTRKKSLKTRFETKVSKDFLVGYLLARTTQYRRRGKLTDLASPARCRSFSVGGAACVPISAPEQALIGRITVQNTARTKRKRIRSKVNACYHTPDIERRTKVQVLRKRGFLGDKFLRAVSEPNLPPKSVFGYFRPNAKVTLRSNRARLFSDFQTKEVNGT